MDQGIMLDIFNQSVKLTLFLSLPVLLVSLVVGLLISIFQATTQIQEQNLSFVPKLIFTFLTLVLTGPWMLNQMLDFTLYIFDSFEKVIG